MGPYWKSRLRRYVVKRGGLARVIGYPAPQDSPC